MNVQRTMGTLKRVGFALMIGAVLFQTTGCDLSNVISTWLGGVGLSAILSTVISAGT